MRSWVVSIAMAALVMTIVGACGDDAPSIAETTAIGQKALTQYGGFGATPAGQHCAGSELVRRLGSDDAEAVAARSDLTKLDPRQRAAVVAALDHCTSINGMLGLSLQALGITSPTDPVASCLRKHLQGKVGTMYIGTLDPKANDLLVRSFDACVPAPLLAKALATDLTTGDSANPAGVDVGAVTACLTPALQGKVGETFRRLMHAKTPAADTLKDLFGPCTTKS
jgi:hypothetical protein